MDILPKILQARLVWLLQGLGWALVVLFWGKLENIIASLSHQKVSLMLLISGALILSILSSWGYLLYKNYEYKKCLLEYNKNHFEEYEFGKWFDIACKKSEKNK